MPPKRISLIDILSDLRAGLRTKQIVAKYGVSIAEFEQILKRLLREGRFTKEEYKAWKALKSAPQASEPPPAPPSAGPDDPDGPVDTYIMPEKDHAWALELFSIQREKMKGAQFKVNLHGRKYAFVVEDLIYRGAVDLREGQQRKAPEKKDKRLEALEFIAKYGWAAYLETRAFEANFGEDAMKEVSQGRLVLILCNNGTFLAALHTPTPSVNFYVSPSLDSLIQRLSRTVDTTHLDIWG